MNGTVIKHESMSNGTANGTTPTICSPRSCSPRHRRWKHAWGWVMAVAAAIMFTVVYGYMYSYGLIMAELMRDFGSSATETGYVGTICYGVSALSCLVTVPISTKLSYRTVALIGITMCATSCIISSMAADLRLMFFSHGVLYGVGTSFSMTAGINVPMTYFRTKHHSLATGLASCGANVGALTMNPITYVLIDSFGWRNMMRIMSGIIFAVGVPCCLTFRQVPEPDESVNERDYDKLPAAALEGNGEVKTIETVNAYAVDHDRTCEVKKAWNGTKEIKDVEEQKYLLDSGSKGSDLAHQHGIGRTNIIQNPLDNTQQSLTAPYTVLPVGLPEAHCNNSNGITHNGLDAKSGHSVWNTSRTASHPTEPYSKETWENATVTGAAATGVIEGKRKSQWHNWMMLLRMPDLWMLEFGLLACAIGLSFLVFSTVNIVLTAGFSKKTAALAMSIMGFTEVIGKIGIGVISDRLPIPKIFIMMFANLTGVGAMVMMLFISSKTAILIMAAVQGLIVLAGLDSMCHSVGNQMFSKKYAEQIWGTNMVFMGVGGIFGAMFGESVDKTGSYVTAFYGNIGIFLASTFLFSLCIVYQRFFATHRYFVFKNVGRRYGTIGQTATYNFEQCEKLPVTSSSDTKMADESRAERLTVL